MSQGCPGRKKKNPQNFLVRAEGTQAQSGAMPALSAGSLWALGALWSQAELPGHRDKAGIVIFSWQGGARSPLQIWGCFPWKSWWPWGQPLCHTAGLGLWTELQHPGISQISGKSQIPGESLCARPLANPAQPSQPPRAFLNLLRALPPHPAQL